MNDEKEVGHRRGESADYEPSEAPSGKEVRDKSDALEIETFLDDRDRERPKWGEFVGVFCLIVLCDLTIYRGEGFAGYALLFLVAPLLLWLSSIRRCKEPGLWIVSAMLAALSFKMVWCGSIALGAIGFALIVALAMSVAGKPPMYLKRTSLLRRSFKPAIWELFNIAVR